MDQLRIVPVKWSGALMSVGPCDSPVVRQQGTTLRGVGRRAGVCASVWGEYPLHNPRKQTDWICRVRCLDEVMKREAELQPHHNLANTHSVHTQTATHSHEFP